MLPDAAPLVVTIGGETRVLYKVCWTSHIRIPWSMVQFVNVFATPIVLRPTPFLSLGPLLQFLTHARSCRPPLDDGTTAIAALVIGKTLLVANGAIAACLPLYHRT